MKLQSQIVPVKIAFIFPLLILISACQSSSDHAEISLDEVPEVTPGQIISTDHIDSLYFGFLGINSVSLPEGDILLTVWDPSKLVRLNADFSEIKAITNIGRGPGEMLSTGVPSTNISNHISTIDQFQKKILVFDENLNVVNEFLPKAYEGYMVGRVFTLSNGKTIFEMFQSNAFLIGKEEHKVLVQYDEENQSYKNPIQLFTKPYAPMGDLIGNASGSARAVPFSDNQFIELHPNRNTLFLFDTRTNIIAEVNADFDTLNSISAKLPKEKLSKSEIDTLKTNFSKEDWKSMESYLPEYKAIANNMLLSENHIWLESNFEADFTKWFVLNMKGDIQKIVNLPKGSRLTHVSDHHLGVRLDDVTFALYEPITD